LRYSLIIQPLVAIKVHIFVLILLSSSELEAIEGLGLWVWVPGVEISEAVVLAMARKWNRRRREWLFASSHCC
jgi:hypothetical protein